MANFDESKHPRAEDGKFTSGSGSSSTQSTGEKTYRQNANYGEILGKQSQDTPAKKEKDILEDLPESAKAEAENFVKEKGWGKEMKNAMFERMASDLNYYFGLGGRSNSVLWAKDFKEHIAIMQALNPMAYKEEIKKYRMIVGKREKDLINN